MSEKELTAQQIKEAIIKAKIENPRKPQEECVILGVKGWLFKVSSFEMEGYREYANNKEGDFRKLSAAKMVQISFRSKDGTACFGEKDVPIIAGLDEEVINPVYRAAMRINGFSLEGLEGILKNLLITLGIDGLYELLANINAPCPNCRKDTPNTSSGSSTSASNTGPPEGQRKAIKPSSSEKS